MRRFVMTIGFGLVLFGASVASAQEQAPTQKEASPAQAPTQKDTAPVQAPTQKDMVQKGASPVQAPSVREPRVRG